MRGTYHGPEYTYVDLLGNSLEMIKDEEYSLDVIYDGPQMIVNGVPVISPDSTYMVVIDNIQIPFSPASFERMWEIHEG